MPLKQSVTCSHSSLLSPLPLPLNPHLPSILHTVLKITSNIIFLCTCVPSKLLRKLINGVYGFEQIVIIAISSVDKNGLINCIYRTVFNNDSILFNK